MTTSILTGVRSVLFAHAHPDDETLATGVLIAELADRGVACHLLTATRGEAGEVVPGSSSARQGSAELEVVRDRELGGAVAALGMASRQWLGTPPARVDGAEPRRYRDSGMRWIRPGLAGPADTSDQNSFTAADPSAPVADLVALIEHLGVDLVVSYASDGGYGHPDHVRMHEVAVAAASAAGVPFAEVIDEQTAGAEWFDLSERLPTVTEALRCHATQLTVDGTDVVHVGGQREPILTAVGLRRSSS